MLAALLPRRLTPDLLSLSAELLSSPLALSPLFPPSGRLSAELSSSSLAGSPFLFDDDKDHDDFTKEWRIEGCSQGQGGLARDLLLKLACRSVASQVNT